MATANESNVPVAAGQTGPNVRCLVQSLNDNGTWTTVYTQAVVLSDPEGNLISPDRLEDLAAPWFVQNFQGAPLGEPVRVDGSAFVQRVNQEAMRGGYKARIASVTTTALLAPPNTRRGGLTIYNESTASLYISPFADVSTTQYLIQIPPSTGYEMYPAWVDPVYGLWSAANGAALVVDFDKV